MRISTQTLFITFALLLSQQDRARQVDTPREVGRICGSLQANLSLAEQQVRELSTRNQQLMENVAALSQQLAEIPTAQVEMWQCVDETRRLRAQLEDAQREIKLADLWQLYTHPDWPAQEQVITEQRLRIQELEAQLTQKTFTPDGSVIPAANYPKTLNRKRGTR